MTIIHIFEPWAQTPLMGQTLPETTSALDQCDGPLLVDRWTSTDPCVQCLKSNAECRISEGHHRWVDPDGQIPSAEPSRESVEPEEVLLRAAPPRIIPRPLLTVRTLFLGGY